jgi:hypothetical protein
MAILEWIGAHLLGPFVNLWRAINARPRPDIRILELKSGGGTDGFVHFNVQLANYGTQQCRCKLRARIGNTVVECSPQELDLIPNELPKGAGVLVPRPQFGELMKECNNATTLYNETLHLQVAAGKHRDDETWHEEVYNADTNRAYWEVQQRYWRSGRGEETEADRLGEEQRRVLGEHEKRVESGEDDPDRYTDV